MIVRHALILVALLVSNSTGTVAQSATQEQVLTASMASQSSAPPPAPGKLTLAAAIDAAQANYPRVRVALEQQKDEQRPGADLSFQRETAAVCQHEACSDGCKYFDNGRELRFDGARLERS